jgi:hypothetical protein
MPGFLFQAWVRRQRSISGGYLDDRAPPFYRLRAVAAPSRRKFRGFPPFAPLKQGGTSGKNVTLITVQMS